MTHAVAAGMIIYHKPCPDSIVYLLLHYSLPSSRYTTPGGHWDFAKGHINENETIKDAAIREVHEETGLMPKVNQDFECSFSYFLRDKEQKSVLKRVHLFLGESTTDTIVLSAEHTEFVWLPFEEAIIQLTHDNARDALAKAHKFLKPMSAISKCCS